MWILTVILAHLTSCDVTFFKRNFAGAQTTKISSYV